LDSYHDNKKTSNIEIAILGAGCFWCVEAIFQKIKGVKSVESGYCGGYSKNPSYEEVCSGQGGHAEVCKITFDNSILSYKNVLKAFWMMHDPTTPNQQGADIGIQYRSAIFCTTMQQFDTAVGMKTEINSSKIFDNPIVTQIQMNSEFYSAERYHHNYYNNNKTQPYCQFVIAPKLIKLKELFVSH